MATKKDSSLCTRGGLDFTWDSDSQKLVNVELQVAVTKVTKPFLSEALRDLTTLLACGEYSTFYGKKHEVDFCVLDEWYEEKLKKEFKKIMVDNGLIAVEQTKTIEELTEACKASLK